MLERGIESGNERRMKKEEEEEEERMESGGIPVVGWRRKKIGGGEEGRGWKRAESETAILFFRPLPVSWPRCNAP